ncbi:MAG: hypothetical protein KDA72_14785, partial [Planctomycetales bacterium]|nr:hypothetical protein [Planctomycetales bacterium]
RTIVPIVSQAIETIALLSQPQDQSWLKHLLAGEQRKGASDGSAERTATMEQAPWGERHEEPKKRPGSFRFGRSH